MIADSRYCCPRPASDTTRRTTSLDFRYAECRGRGCAGLFLTPTGVVGFCPDLVRVARDLFFGEANAFFPKAVIIAVPLLDCAGGFEVIFIDAAEHEEKLRLLV